MNISTNDQYNVATSGLSARKSYLKECTDSDLTDWLREHGQSEFRARQIREWLYKKYAKAASEMTNLPKSLRAAIEGDFYVFSGHCVDSSTSQDGSVKYLLALPDSVKIETVLIPASNRDTVCVSTQAGCPVHCRFCASGRSGLYRNLTPQEIVDQIIFVAGELEQCPTNVVLMGIGEPLLNIENVLSALYMMVEAGRLNLSARHITVSTSGIVPGIQRLADEGKQWNLAVSLHGASDKVRAQIIPGQYRYRISDIMAACRYYREKTKRMVTFEYTFLPGINDTPDQATGLAEIADSLKAKVNLIPWNPTGFHPDSETEGYDLRQFAYALEKQGVRVTIRRSRGQDVNAACGQLRAARS